MSNDPVEMALTDVLTLVTSELPTLLASGQNWQLTLHGGRGGDVRMELLRTREVTPSRKRLLEERKG